MHKKKFCDSLLHALHFCLFFIGLTCGLRGTIPEVIRSIVQIHFEVGMLGYETGSFLKVWIDFKHHQSIVWSELILLVNV